MTNTASNTTNTNTPPKIKPGGMEGKVRLRPRAMGSGRGFITGISVVVGSGGKGLGGCSILGAGDGMDGAAAGGISSKTISGS